MKKNQRNWWWNLRKKRRHRIRRNPRNKNCLRKSKTWRRSFWLVQKQWNRLWSKNKNSSRQRMLSRTREESKSELHRSSSKGKRRKLLFQLSLKVSKKSWRLRREKRKRFKIKKTKFKVSSMICKILFTVNVRILWRESVNLPVISGNSTSSSISSSPLKSIWKLKRELIGLKI